jgi:hypothetical protein
LKRADGDKALSLSAHFSVAQGLSGELKVNHMQENLSQEEVKTWRGCGI